MTTKCICIRLLVAAVTLLVALGCVGDRDKAKQEKARLKAYVLESAPKDVGRKLNIDYDGKLSLLGAKIEPRGALNPGQEVKLTLYWKSEKKLDPGWNLFTHVLDGSGERILNADNVGPLREWRDEKQVLGPSEWEPGKYYVDAQSFKLPEDIKTRRLQVVVGAWKDKDRLKVSSGPRDRENRGIVASIGVRTKEDRVRLNTRVPQLTVGRVPKGEKVSIDGKLDEEAWRTAARTGRFIDPDTGRVNRDVELSGRARMMWDDEGLYVAIDVRDKDVSGGFDAGVADQKLWTKDAVEIMLDPDGDGDNRDYYEIQVNPQNLVFDSQFDAYNEPRKEPDGPFGHQEWSSEIKSAVEVRGTLDKPDDKDQGYVVEALIPWKALTKAKQTPPKVGDSWRINLYVLQNNGGVAWSAILKQGNFHKASRFGKVTFAEEGPGRARRGQARRLIERGIGPRQLQPGLVAPRASANVKPAPAPIAPNPPAVVPPAPGP